MWDYRLLKAQYILNDWYRDGVPIWWDESDNVTFEAEARISKSKAAIERAQEKAGKAKRTVHGRYFVAKPIAIGGKEMPTRGEWIEEQNIKKGVKKSNLDFSKNEPAIVQGRK
jgi:hypothetical protein